MNRMKSWESPRRGRQRNDRSKAAIARLRQLKKRNQRLRQKLRQQSKNPQAPSSGVFVWFRSCTTSQRTRTMSGEEGGIRWDAMHRARTIGRVVLAQGWETKKPSLSRRGREG
jgi:hypothetical protein